MMYRLVCLFLLLGLSACSVTPKANSVTSNALSLRHCPDVTEVFVQWRKPHEVTSLPGREACPGERLRYVGQQLILNDSRPDYARLQNQMDLAMQSLRQESSDSLSGLAQYLSMQMAVRRHQEDQVSRLAGQLADQQRRSEDLAAKLDALKAIEQALATRTKQKVKQP